MLQENNPPDLISLDNIYNIIPKKIIMEIFKDYNIKTRDSLHDLYHALRVIENGFIISDFNKSNRTIIVIYSIFHDIYSWKCSDRIKASEESANLIIKYRDHINATDEEINKAFTACLNVYKSKKSDDLDIGSCYDADMLDLIRKNIYPEQKEMNTKIGKNSSIIVLCNKKALNNTFPDWSIELVSSFI